MSHLPTTQTPAVSEGCPSRRLLGWLAVSIAGRWANRRSSRFPKIVLALVDEAPKHGFAVAALTAETGELGRAWHLPRPIVYRAVTRLTDLGLVRVQSTEPGQRGPQRSVLAVTGDGAGQTARWLREPVPHVRDVRSALLAKRVGCSPTSGRCSPRSRPRCRHSGWGRRSSATSDNLAGRERPGGAALPRRRRGPARSTLNATLPNGWPRKTNKSPAAADTGWAKSAGGG